MGSHKVRFIKHTCDEWGCKKSLVTEDMGLPRGWGCREVHGCGMTNYNREDILCPSCWRKHKAKEKLRD